MKNISRREFLHGVTAGAVGVAALGMLGTVSAEGTNAQVDWDAEFDVVVVGFGAAGAIAAVTAAEQGAKVLLMEKAPLNEEGGNSRYCYQLILRPTDREKMITYYKGLRSRYSDQSDEIIECIVDGLCGNYDWVLEHGVDPDRVFSFNYIEYPELEGSEAALAMTVNGGGADSKFWKLVRELVYSMPENIEVWNSTPAVSFIQDSESKIVLGIKAENAGEYYNIRAKNGVVMALGGFENNDAMLQNYAQLAGAHAKGSHYNDGDGVRMAIEIGADLWHMSALSGPDVNFVNPETNNAMGYALTNTAVGSWFNGFPRFNMIIVGGDGTRFMDEATYPRHGHVPQGGTYFSLHVPDNCWCVFDESARLATPAYPSWSEGMVEEIEKGWVKKADTLEELAEICGIDPAGLTAEIALYNGFCAAGFDPDFDVRPECLLPLETAPFYAFVMRPTNTNTQGGARRNTNCEILDVWGNPIPHLYSAGEYGSFYCDIYNGGGNVGECIFTGCIAGANAAAAKDDVDSESAMGGKTPVCFTETRPEFEAGANEYIGVGDGMGGDFVVKVTMDGTTIQAIEPLYHHETAVIGTRAIPLMIDKILEAQDTLVDIVAGATVSSIGVMTAVADALSKDVDLSSLENSDYENAEKMADG